MWMDFNQSSIVGLGDEHRVSYISHLTSALLPHYLAKFECLTVHLYSEIIQFKNVQNHLLSR